MDGIIAMRTFLGWSADEWSAVGIWVTIAVYLTLALFAWWQLREARSLRVHQSRPYMVAEIQGRSNLIYLVFKNIGATQAQNVKIKFDDRLVGSKGRQLEWQVSAAFVTGIPTFAPGFKLRFFFDSFPLRRDEGLPMRIAGRLLYEDTLGNEYDEPFVIDLTVFGDALQAEKDMVDLVDEVKRIREEMAKWTDGHSGLRVSASNRDNASRADERSIRLVRTKLSYEQDGRKAAIRTWLRHSALGQLRQRWTSW